MASADLWAGTTQAVRQPDRGLRVRERHDDRGGALRGPSLDESRYFFSPVCFSASLQDWLTALSFLLRQASARPSPGLTFVQNF